MASAAFRSTTRRSAAGEPGEPAEDAGSATRPAHRRHRSLSRGPARFPPPPPEAAEQDEFPTPRGRFVNKSRGSEFPEISLDDLAADDFFWSRSGSAGRTGRRVSDVSPRVDSRVRGRSVAKAAPDVKGGVDGGASRRRRSLSVARYRGSDAENDMDLPRRSSTQNKIRSLGSGNFQQPSLHKPKTSGPVLSRSMSQRDLLQAHDSYSSHSSSLTDDEAWEVHSSKSGTEKTIRAVYSLEKMEHPAEDGDRTGFYEAMRKEVRNAVGEIRTELEKAMVKPVPASIVNGDGSQSKSTDVIEVIADIRRNCTNKLEESEKRKQELLAELAVEEQRGEELTKIVRELLPVPKQSSATERPSRSRRRNNDRTTMSKRLDEEAERYFEDFLSNVEDTDVSSFDGERSDTSSAIGGNAKRNSAVLNTVSEIHADIIQAASLPVETDGVVFPWLQWETSNDISPLPCKSKMRVPVVLGNNLYATAQEARSAADESNDLRTSLGSWSPGGNGCSSLVSKGVISGSRWEVGSNQSNTSTAGRKVSSFDMDEYLILQRNEDLLFERLSQRNRIESGSLILCGRNLI